MIKDLETINTLDSLPELSNNSEIKSKETIDSFLRNDSQPKDLDEFTVISYKRRNTSKKNSLYSDFITPVKDFNKESAKSSNMNNIFTKNNTSKTRKLSLPTILIKILKLKVTKNSILIPPFLKLQPRHI